MGKFIKVGEYESSLPDQSSNITEWVKYFESAVSIEDLQDQINAWLVIVNGPTITDRPGIRDISFYAVVTNLPGPDDIIIHYAQVHFILIGDKDDGPAAIGA